MGGGRLPRSQALSLGLVAVGLALSVSAGACWFGGDADEPEPTPAPETVSATATSTPEPTATPNLLATPPADQTEAQRWLLYALAANDFAPPCPQVLLQYSVGCAQGDADGDGQPELVYLVPLKPKVRLAPYPAAVFIRRSSTRTLEVRSADVDASAIGASVFAVEDRTGDGKRDLTYLENRCSATGCKTVAIVDTWDGTAWRNVGPGTEPVANVDLVKWEGTGAASKLIIHGGKALPDAPKEAGPTRATTTTYTFTAARYNVDSVKPDDPEYLYHAVLDADRVFDDNKAASIAAYQAVLDDGDLKNWAPPSTPDKERRPALQGYALFRIALAHAAIQSDPRELTEALDDVINHGVQTGEPLFAIVTEEFRRGYANNGLSSGCASVMAYIYKDVPGTNTRGYIADTFSYGYENPPGSTWVDKLCPF